MGISGNIVSTKQHVTGMKELEQVLNQFPDHFKERVMRLGVYEAAKAIRVGIQAYAPFKSGLLQSSIRIARRKRDVPRDLLTYVVYVHGVRASTGRLPRVKKGQRPLGTSITSRTDSNKLMPYYWYFLEFGTSRMDKHQFIVPGFVAASSIAYSNMVDYIVRNCDREMRKIARLNAKSQFVRDAMSL